MTLHASEAAARGLSCHGTHSTFGVACGTLLARRGSDLGGGKARAAAVAVRVLKGGGGQDMAALREVVGV